MFVGVLATFALVAAAMIAMTYRHADPPKIVFLAAFGILWTAMIIMARVVYRAASALGAGSPALWAVGAFISPLNLLLVLALSSRVNEALRAQGVRVGFFGPEL